MKYLSILKYVLTAVSAILVLVFFLGWTDVDAMLRWTYILMGLAIVCIIVMPTINMVQDPKSAIGTLVGLAIVVVVGIAAYAVASADPIAKADGGFFDNAIELKLSDVGLYLSYLSIAGAILVAVLGEVRNAFK